MDYEERVKKDQLKIESTFAHPVVGHLGNPPSLQPKIVIGFVTPLGHEQLVGLQGYIY